MNRIDISKYERIKTLGRLPSPKGVALAILHLSQKEDVSNAELSHVIKSDPAFVSRLLKAANSASLHTGRPIVSVPDALVVMGIAAVRNLALGFSLLQQHRGGPCRAFDYPRYWSYSLACAIAAQNICQQQRGASPEEMFSVGLLSRVGELGLATVYPEEFSKVISDCLGHVDDPAYCLEVEEAAFAMDHRELTGAMLADWGLPKLYCNIAFHHEFPEQATCLENSREETLLYSLSLARQIARLCVLDVKSRDMAMPDFLKLGARLNLDEGMLIPLCDRIVKEWQEWASILSVPAQQLPPFEQILHPPVQQRRKAESADGRQLLPLRVLVVEDDKGTRTELCRQLSQSGFEVLESEDGRAGLAAALEHEPHIVLIDWVMPELDGINLTRALRKTRVGRRMYVLVLTAMEDEASLIEAFEAGVDDYVRKPIKWRLLAARIKAGERVLRLQQELDFEREEARRLAAQLTVINRKLQETCLTDTLTGLHNKRHAMESLNRVWGSSVRNKRPLACLLIDMDEFRQINDHYGQQAGDACLAQTAETLRSLLRSDDIICRTAGDEFLVLCPDTDKEAAGVCAERVRAGIESHTLHIDSLCLTGTVSVGVVERTDKIEDGADMLALAEHALKQAKADGKNKVRFAS